MHWMIKSPAERTARIPMFNIGCIFFSCGCKLPVQGIGKGGTLYAGKGKNCPGKYDTPRKYRRCGQGHENHGPGINWRWWPRGTFPARSARPGPRARMTSLPAPRCSRVLRKRSRTADWCSVPAPAPGASPGRKLRPKPQQRRLPARPAAGAAVLFGRESSGLSNEELEICHAMIRIPTNAEFASLNIASAVQIICYEISKQYLARETG